MTSTPQSDDVAFLSGAHARAQRQDHVASWDVASDPAAVAGARALATRQLRAWELEELTMATELVVGGWSPTRCARPAWCDCDCCAHPV